MLVSSQSDLDYKATEQEAHSFSGFSIGTKRVWAGSRASSSSVQTSSAGAGAPSALAPTAMATIGKTLAMFFELRMTVVTPAPVASSAAMILVSIPPVPSEVPSVAVLTGGGGGTHGGQQRSGPTWRLQDEAIAMRDTRTHQSCALRRCP